MEEKFYKKDNWWISHYNFHEEVTRGLDLPEKVEIHDATLRDGEQTPGVVMSLEDKVAIAAKLDEIGIDRIEAGMPAVSKQDFDAICKITGMGLRAKIFTFARALNVDIDSAVDCGAYGVILEVPIGYPKLKYQFGWTWEDVLHKSVDVINYAKDKGLYVVFFPYDTTRARHEDLVNLLTGITRDSGPDAIGLVDTMGCATPEAIRFMTRLIQKLTSLPVEIHTHNDFGMGVATELAAITAGAQVVHSCANGLGERTGNAALEDLIMNLQIMYGMETNYKLELLPELGELVSRVSNIPIAPNKPVLGSRNFTRESGIGVDLVIKEPLAMFGTHPALTGRHGEIVLGKKSGKASVIYNLEVRGIDDYSSEQVAQILDMVKQKGIAKKSTLTDKEFDDLVAEVLRA